MTFRVGQKVVCVSAKGGFRNLLGEVMDSNELRLGAIYTIRWYGWEDDIEGVRLEEITSRHAPPSRTAHNEGRDVPFAARKFAPLEERKTDISALTALLNPKTRELIPSVIGEDINTL